MQSFWAEACLNINNRPVKVSALEEAVTVCGTVKKFSSIEDEDSPQEDRRRFFKPLLQGLGPEDDNLWSLIGCCSWSQLVCSDALILTETLAVSSSSSSSPSSAFSGIVTEPFRQFGDEETMEPDLDPWSRLALPGSKGACKDVIELLLCKRESNTLKLLAAASLCSSSSGMNRNASNSKNHFLT